MGELFFFARAHVDQGTEKFVMLVRGMVLMQARSVTWRMPSKFLRLPEWAPNSQLRLPCHKV